MKITKKAYKVDLSKIDEGFLYCPSHCFANNRIQAKTKLLHDVDAVLLNGDELTYLNIPVVRDKENDIVDYKDDSLKRGDIPARVKLEKQTALEQSYLADPKITHCYIRKRGLYYGHDYCGYTDFKHKAGIYSTADAVKHCGGNIELTCKPIDIAEHNEILLNEIARIRKGIIEN